MVLCDFFASPVSFFGTLLAGNYGQSLVLAVAVDGLKRKQANQKSSSQYLETCVLKLATRDNFSFWPICNESESELLEIEYFSKSVPKRKMVEQLRKSYA
jgi:hypothetical protein